MNCEGEMDFHRANTLRNGCLKDYQEMYIRKVVSELNQADNLFFEIQNEPWADNGNVIESVNEGDEKVFSRSWQKKVEVANGLAHEWQAWVASVIRDQEKKLPKKHLIAQNICNFQHKLDHLPPGVEMVNFHYAHPEAVIWNLDLGGVVGLDETGFMPHEDLLYINQAWRFMLSGGGLYNNLDYSFTAGNEEGDWPIPDTNPGWGGAEFRRKLSLLVNTFDKVPFWQMDYSEGVIQTDSESLSQYGLQKPGEVYLLFLEDYLEAEIIPDIPVGEYDITWLNVETGEERSQTDTLGEERVITPLFKEKQVVLMISKTN
jgi:hypothetical protein